jgi:hypothetical protein
MAAPGETASRLFVLTINDFDEDGNSTMTPIKIFLNPDDAIDFYATTSTFRPTGQMPQPGTFQADLNMLRRLTFVEVYFKDDSDNLYLLKLTPVVGNMYGGQIRRRSSSRSAHYKSRRSATRTTRRR